MVSKPGSNLTMWMGAEQNDMVSPLTDGVSHKAYPKAMKEKS